MCNSRVRPGSQTCSLNENDLQFKSHQRHCRPRNEPNRKLWISYPVLIWNSRHLRIECLTHIEFVVTWFLPRALAPIFVLAGHSLSQRDLVDYIRREERLCLYFDPTCCVFKQRGPLQRTHYDLGLSLVTLEWSDDLEVTLTVDLGLHCWP